MFDPNAETLTYEPISFIVQRSAINPDSPRHFINGRNDTNAINNINNNNNSNSNNNSSYNYNNKTINIITKRQSVFSRKKFRQRQSLMDFLPSTLTGRLGSRHNSDVTAGMWNGTTPHIQHSPGMIRSKTIEGLGLEGRLQSYTKPITSRLKIREKRRLTLNGKEEIRHPSLEMPLLTRSKSDVGTYNQSKELSREEMQKKCRALLKARLCAIDSSSTDSFSEADSCLESSGSSFYELFPNRQYSESPSSGFCTESEETDTWSSSRGSSVFIPVTKTKAARPKSADIASFAEKKNVKTTLSSRSSAVFIPISKPAQARPKSAEISTFDYDKDAETKLYSKSLEKSRRPLSIVRSQSFGRQNGSDDAANNNVAKTDDVFLLDSDSDTDDVKYDVNGKRKSFSPKIAAIVKDRKLRQKVSRQAPVKTVHKMAQGTDSDDKTTFKDVTNNSLIMDKEVIDVKDVIDTNQRCDTRNGVGKSAVDKDDKTDPKCPFSSEEAKDDGKMSLEQYVHKLSQQTPVANSNKQSQQTPVVHNNVHGSSDKKKSVRRRRVMAEADKWSGLGVVSGFGAVKNIRIESVL